MSARFRNRVVAVGLGALVAVLAAQAGTPAGASPEEARSSDALVPIERFVLPNGMTFLLVDRPNAVDIAAGWVVGVGSAGDPEGRTGLSHMLEHMLFKGTRTIGTTALKRDLALIEREDRLWERIVALEAESGGVQTAETEALYAELRQLTEAGRGIRRSGEIDLLYARAGATGLNAVTMLDLTAYFVSLPPEKIELWFWLESDRLLDPVFREFHVEKQVVVEERRLRIESTPTGELEEALLGRLWASDPYGRPAIGSPADLARLGRTDAREHFEAHYGAENVTAVLVGPVREVPVRSLAERYFGRLDEGPETLAAAAASATPEPGEPLVATCDCRPQARAVYPGVAHADPDEAALELLVGLLNGRTGRLYRSLVLEQEIAFSAFAGHTPLARGGQFTLTAEAKGATRPAELLAALDHEIARLTAEPPDEKELQKVKNRLRAEALRRLRAPAEVLMQLLIHTGLGRSDQVNRWIAAIDAVTVEDVERVLAMYVVPSRRVVGLWDRAEATGGATEGGAP